MTSAQSKTNPTWTLAHLMLLNKYVRGRQVDLGGNAHWDQHWLVALRESIQDTTKRFVESGLLEECPLLDRVTCKFNQIALKQMLRERGLKVSGRKDELANRLVATDRDGMLEATREYVMMRCTEKGLQLAKEFSARTEEMQQTALQALRRKDLETATRCVCQYQDELGFPEDLTFPTRPDIADLRRIFSAKPKILGPVGDEVLDTLRVAAGMAFLGIKGQWISDDLEISATLDGVSAVGMIISKIQSDRNLEGYKQGGVTQVKIMGSADGPCSRCEEIQSKTWKLISVPELPYEHCTSEGGCRCCYIAVLD